MTEANEQTQNPGTEAQPTPQADYVEVPPKGTPCVNHPDKAAFRVCRMCAGAFCIKCLTHHMGLYYCEKCRRTAIAAINAEDEKSEAVAVQFHRKSGANEMTDYAQRAFRWALIGLIPVAGIVISIIALIWGFSAIANPPLAPGKKKSQKAMYAVIISAGSFIVQIIAGLALLIMLGK